MLVTRIEPFSDSLVSPDGRFNRSERDLDGLGDRREPFAQFFGCRRKKIAIDLREQGPEA
jgi:hypothetical protein